MQILFYTLLAFFMLFSQSTKAQTPMKLLTNVHSHNDYEQKRPLLEALDNGFCSIEADIYLVEGKLLVAHDRDKVSPDKTLQGMYLDPLLERVRKNNGKVYPKGPTVILLIDVKNEAENTYRALRDALKPYKEMLTVFHKDKTDTRAVTIIISGARARQLMEEDRIRYTSYDGRMGDLGKGISAHFMPLVSDSWTSVFFWLGVGQMKDTERQKLHELVDKAHKEGYKFRLWGCPDVPAVWKELRDAGVDLINTDKLKQLREFLLEGHRESFSTNSHLK